MHQCVEMLTLLELCELVGVADTASVGQILVIQFACRIGNFQDALVGSLLVSSSGITTMTEVAGQTGPGLLWQSIQPLPDATPESKVVASTA
jgi:hypothetical protein